MDDQSRQLYFWLGCIPTRIILVLIAYFLPLNYLPYYGIVTLLISLGFIRAFFFSNKNVGFFKGDIWWNNLRLVHAVLYLSFSIGAFLEFEYSWVFLLIDVIIGMISFINEYY